MISCFVGCLNDILIERNGRSILLRGSKQNHTGWFRHGIHEVGDGDLGVPFPMMSLFAVLFLFPCTMR